jgi:hypothetical protein
MSIYNGASHNYPNQTRHKEAMATILAETSSIVDG